MSNRRYIRGTLRRDDYARCLLTDTAPYEVPLVVSNDGFYKNVTNVTHSAQLAELIDALVRRPRKSYTIPYRYKIAKDSLSVRNLSLLHPRSQYGVSEFYRTYDTLISMYCSKGEFSIRRPTKSGSSFYFRSPISDTNQYKSNRVDTTDIDMFVRNPASFFSYRGVDRLYKFFSSNEFLRLEKKFPNMTLMDVSKCFPSIYTHSVSWAIKGATHSKNNTGARSFGNDFDRLMQRMNFNETNGICIGPEVSRIFAEIILNAVDLKVQSRAETMSLRHGRDYECRRYVDDYILFSKSDDVSSTLYRIIDDCLTEYNLHLNELKLQKYVRPFLTPKSHVISTTKLRLQRFYDGITEKINAGLLVPSKIFRPGATVRSLVTSIKSGCYEHGVGYEMVANYVIASLAKRVEKIVSDFGEATSAHDVSKSLYAPLLARLMEAIFFFYTVQPTVASSFNVSRSMIVLGRFIREFLPDEELSISGHVQRWVSQLLRQHNTHREFAHHVRIQVEFLNVILASAEFDPLQRVSEQVLEDFIFDEQKEDYFSLVSRLFYVKDHAAYARVRATTEACILRVLGNCSGAVDGAHDAYLALDSICCPYLSVPARTAILANLRSALGLDPLTIVKLEELVGEMQGNPWFVQWQNIDILSMIRKKELSAVY